MGSNGKASVESTSHLLNKEDQEAGRSRTALTALFSHIQRQQLLTIAALIFLSSASILHALDVDSVVPEIRRLGPQSATFGEVVKQVYPTRYGDLMELAENFSGSVVIVEKNVWSPVLIRAVGGASDVRSATRSDSFEQHSEAGIEIKGVSRRGAWSIYASNSGARNFLLTTEKNGYQYIDMDLIELASESHDAALNVESPAKHLLFRGALVDVAFYIFSMIIGFVLVGQARLPHRSTPWISLVVGMASFSAISFLFLKGLTPVIVLGAGVTIIGFFRRAFLVKKIANWSQIFTTDTFVALSVVTILAILVRTLGLVWVTPDSIDILARSSLLGSGEFRVTELDHEFYMGQQAVHAIGFAIGGVGVLSIGWVSLSAATAILLAVARRLWSKRLSHVLSSVLILLAFFTVGSPNAWRLAGYVNSHMFVAALLLTVVVVHSSSQTECSSPILALSVLFASLVFLRGEAPLVLALYAAGVSQFEVNRRSAASAYLWLLIAAPTALWSLVLSWISASEGQSPPRTVIFGGLLAVVFSIAWWAHKKCFRWLPFGLVSLLTWLALGATVAVLPSVMGPALQGLRENIWRGGAGGVALPVLTVLTIALVAVVSPPATKSAEVGLRTLLLAYIPTVVLARVMAIYSWSRGSLQDLGVDFVIRSGWADSTSRVLFHVWFLAVFALIHHVARPVTQEKGLGWTGRVLLIFLLGAFISSQWLGISQILEQLLWWSVLGALILILAAGKENNTGESGNDF